jgi:hypothetical protein
VFQLAADTGAVRWQQRIRRQQARLLSLDVVSDEVVVAGTVETAYGPVRGADFFVAKLAGDTGAERWRRIVTFPYGQPFAIAVDARGDVVVGGHLKNIETGADWTVVRLAGDTGDERWRHVVDGPAHGSDVAEAIALEASGGVVVAGTLQAAAESWQVLVTRLDGATGVERWRRIAANDDAPIPPPVALTAAGNGDALLTSAETAGVQEQNLLVARVAGNDGSEAWRRLLSGSAPGVGWGDAIVERADGVVVVAGRTVNAGSGPDFTLATLASADGSDVPAVQ